MIRVHTYGLEALAADFDRAAGEITKETAKVTGKACRQMQLDARRRVSGKAHLPHLGRSFTYDVKTGGTTVTGEVGAEHERLQAKLDVWIENGSPTSAPIPHWAPAADKEVPVWESFLEKVAAELIDGSP